MSKLKPGPKPKASSEKARPKNYSYPARIADFLETLPSPGAFVVKQIAKSKEYKKYVNNL